MRVEEAMKHAASSCTADTSLTEVAARLAEPGCGVLAVVTSSGRVLGILTDRDVCRVFGRSNAGASVSGLRARDAMIQGPAAVSRHEDIGVALARMRAHRLRRIPVTDGEGRLEGILALDDLTARLLPPASDDGEDLLRTLRVLGAALT